MIKIPKYIVNELQKASDYANKLSECIKSFENWVKNNIDEEFDFELLRGGIYYKSEATEALTEIEYGNDADISELERVLNAWVEEIKS